MNGNKTLMLIDTNNMGFMAFGRVPLKYKGVRTELLSIGLAMVRRYLTNFAPDEVRFVFDGGRDERRTSVYPEYKRRPKPPLTPAELKERHCFFKQLKIFSENMHRLGFTQIKCKGREADDVIYSIIKCVLEDKTFDQVIVVSSDSDMFQLFQHFGDRVKVYHPIRDVLYDETAIMEVYNVPTKWFLTYRAMVGDTSDNLPGVKGLGPVKAITLVDILNRDSSDHRGDNITSEKKLLMFLLENEKAFELMRFLITFLPISQEEIQAGTHHTEMIPDAKLEQLLALGHRYGLEQLLLEFVPASDAFRQYWLREFHDRGLSE